MNTHTASAAEVLKLRIDFEAIRQSLLEDRYEDRLQRPLAYWALQSDRGLPFALLDRRVGDLLRMSFDEIAATPRIGQKKIRTLIKLLHRAAAEESTLAATSGQVAEEVAQEMAEFTSRSQRFEPARVAELHWDGWRETVRRHGLGRELLGRLAPSLRALPTVIWKTPLSSYLELSLAEMRQLKTHGEKRISVVLEVFYAVHQILGTMGSSSRLDLRLMPPFIRPLEESILASLRKLEGISAQEVQQTLVLPLLNQLDVDLGSVVHDLAAERLGVEIPPQTVRQQARRMGVTRARVYQMLEMCAEVLEVRWPEGGPLLGALVYHAERIHSENEAISLLKRLRALCYPVRPVESSGADVIPAVEPALMDHERQVAS